MIEFLDFVLIFSFFSKNGHFENESNSAKNLYLDCHYDKLLEYKIKQMSKFSPK